MNENDDNSMHSVRKCGTSIILLAYPHAQLSVRVQEKQLLLSTQLGGGIDLGLTTDRIFKEHPQPLSAIIDNQQQPSNTQQNHHRRRSDGKSVSVEQLPTFCHFTFRVTIKLMRLVQKTQHMMELVLVGRGKEETYVGDGRTKRSLAIVQFNTQTHSDSCSAEFNFRVIIQIYPLALVSFIDFLFRFNLWARSFNERKKLIRCIVEAVGKLWLWFYMGFLVVFLSDASIHDLRGDFGLQC